jgi:hypothetical protein
MIHLSPDFWTRRYIVIENHTVASSWEVVAVTRDGLLSVGNWPGSADSRHGSRTIPWDEVKAWYVDPHAASAHAERMNKKQSA